MPDYSYVDPEMIGGYGYAFTEKSIRQGFIRKVYAILMVQLLITFGFIALFVFSEPVSLWTRQNPGFFIGVLILSLVMMIVLTCCDGVRRKSPTNFICLFIFTVAEGVLLGVAASTFRTDEVLLAAGITVVVCGALTAFSFQTKFDVTGMGGYLLVATVVLLLLGFLSIFLSSVFPIINLVYASLGALLFSFYLVFDTQLILGGKHKFTISPEEYIFASLNIYLDIINIFMYILTIIGSSRD